MDISHCSIGTEPRHDPLVIRPPNSLSEYSQACRFVEDVYRGVGYFRGTTKIVHPGAFLLAMRNTRLVGAIGIQSGDQGVLPTEESFGCRVIQLKEVQPARIFEAQRLAVSDRGDRLITKGLIAAMISYARTNYGCTDWIMTVKPTLMKLLWRNCYLNAEVLSVTLSPGIAEKDPGYFATLPTPIAIRMHRKYTDNALSRLAPELEQKVLIDLANFDHHLDHGSAKTYQR